MSIKRLKDLPDGSGSLSNDDIFLFMDDPSGSGITKKISLSEIGSAIGGGGGISNSLSGVAHNDVLVYNSGTQYWENNNKVVFSDTNGITGASGVSNIVQISQSDYDNLGSYTPNTIYFIT